MGESVSWGGITAKTTLLRTEVDDLNRVVRCLIEVVIPLLADRSATFDQEEVLRLLKDDPAERCATCEVHGRCRLEQLRAAFGGGSR